MPLKPGDVAEVFCCAPQCFGVAWSEAPDAQKCRNVGAASTLGSAGSPKVMMSCVLLLSFTRLQGELGMAVDAQVILPKHEHFLAVKQFEWKRHRLHSLPCMLATLNGC